MDYNKVIFKNKTVADLMAEAYKDKKDKDTQLSGLIEQLKEFIETPGDAVMMVPLLKEYMDLSIKNSDTITKIIGIVQKFEAAQARAESNGGGEFGLSETEKQQLFDSLNELGLESGE